MIQSTSRNPLSLFLSTMDEAGDVKAGSEGDKVLMLNSPVVVVVPLISSFASHLRAFESRVPAFNCMRYTNNGAGVIERE